jgi:hypothetical protein
MPANLRRRIQCVNNSRSNSHYARRFTGALAVSAVLLERRHLAGMCVALLGWQTFGIPNQC